MTEYEQRMKGEFYTPTIWVDEAHKMISSVFGENWKDEYVVWDCACGTGNLTRDYKFKELYLSTINESDLGIIEQHGINPEAKKFRMDFLNDEMPDFIDKDKKILFFINPPYGTSSDLKLGTSKKGIAYSKTHTKMKSENMGDAVKQLYAQFLYRMMKEYKNVSIATFSMPLFLSGQKFKQFRKKFLERFEYKKAMLFNAGHFNNVSSAWGVSFSLWKSGETKNKSNFVYSIKDMKGFDVVKVGEKVVYNIDDEVPLNKWARKDTYGIKQFDAPQLSNAINVKQKGWGRLCKNTLGYMYSATNVIQGNAQGVGLFTSTFSGSNSNGYSIFSNNFMKTLALFTARRIIKREWYNGEDEYSVPKTTHPDYPQWNNDCLVYSLFNNKSNQSSLRNVEYKKKIWNIENEWFFMSNLEMKELANENHNDEVYKDARNFNKERFVYEKLKDISLSKDASYVLNMAKQLVVKSFPFRKTIDEEYHLNTWDAGWYQIKKLLNRYFREEYREFVSEYKAFEKRMREGVFTFGFLKNAYEPSSFTST